MYTYTKRTMDVCSTYVKVKTTKEKQAEDRVKESSSSY